MNRRTVVAGLLAVLGILSADSLAAQQPQQAQEPMARFIVTRAFQCSPQGGGVAWLQAWRPVVQEMIAEGKFMDYGILTHAWGDEWNVNDYFVVADVTGFMQNFPELVRRIGERKIPAPTVENAQGERVARPPFGEICTAHKDNIYGIVQPPSGG